MFGLLRQADVDKSYEPRQVLIVKSVRCGRRDDYLWVRLQPPIESWEAGNKEQLSMVMLAPRLAGSTLDVPLAHPTDVYVCTVRGVTGPLPLEVAPEDVQIRHWGVVDPSAPARSSD